MDFNDEVEIRTASFARRRGKLDGGFHHAVDACVDVMHRIELEGGETFRHGITCGSDHGIRRAGAAEKVQSDPVTTTPAEQIPYRRLIVFPFDVPQGDVDGANCT